MIKTTKEIVDKWYDYQFRKTRGLSRQWISLDELKEVIKRLDNDCEFFIKNQVGQSLESALITIRGNIQVEFDKFFPSLDSPALKIKKRRGVK